MEAIELPVLRCLQLKGRAHVRDIVRSTGATAADVDGELRRLTAGGLVCAIRGRFVVLPAGRSRVTELLARERASVDSEALLAEYECFCDVRAGVKELADDWQLRHGMPNDHADADYDQGVLDRFPAVHEGAMPVVDRMVALVPRLHPYPGRLTAAYDRVRSGEEEWLLRPLVESYRTVWFELHEELIWLTGRGREALAAPGRTG